MPISINKRALLKEAQEYCDENDKSTEFMIEYMQDFANLDLDAVLEFLHEQHDENEN